MPEILVLSGKGGTGKTTITASLAHLAGAGGERPVICDLDVDAPDLHLLLNPKPYATHQFRSGNVAEIDQEACTGCGECLEACRFDALELRQGAVAVNPLRCEGCKVCVTLCPARAVDFPVRYCGDWYQSTCRLGPMIHAQLFPGQENSGRLVALLRQQAREFAKERGHGLIISDGPPGIGCPVISSLSGTDLAVIVTEPTQSGLHDLGRVVDLCRHFRVPAMVVLNKFDLAPDLAREVEAFCEEKALPLAGRLPYTPKAVEAMLAGKSLSEFDPEGLGRELERVLERIRQCALEARAA